MGSLGVRENNNADEDAFRCLVHSVLGVFTHGRRGGKS
jgi:hypothetical protein